MTNAERELLLGVLGSTLGFIPRQAIQGSAFVETLAGTTDGNRIQLSKNHTGIAATMEAAGTLTPSRRAFLEHMVDETLAFCEGDLSKAVEMFGGDVALDETFGGVGVRISASGEATVGKRLEVPKSTETLRAITNEHAGRYTRTGELGRGGIGRVVYVHDAHLARDVAMKELLPNRAQLSLGQLSTPMVRFLREARVTGQLEHPNIVPVYELGKRLDGSLYYTMKVVRGRTLSDVLHECRTLDDRIKLLPHFAQVCHAIAYAHDRGVVHRDIKPDNIMIGEFGETMVLDWGLAKASDEEDLRGQELAKDAERLRGLKSSQTVDGQLIGTPLYMSPEQANGDIANIGPSSDVWSLGAILYEILTGTQAFAADSLVRVVERVTDARFAPVLEATPEVSAELAAICEKALTPDREKRFDSAEVLADEIEAFLTGKRIQSYTYSFTDLVKRWAKKHRAVFAVATVAFVLLVIFGLSTHMKIREERDLAVQAQTTATNAESRAAHERDRAEGLVQYMLTTLKDELGPIGKLKLLDSVVNAILEYYQELGLERVTSRHQMARALNISAEVQMSQGKPADAIRSIEQAETLLSGLPRDLDTRAIDLQRARSHLLTARLHFSRGEHARAEPRMQAAHTLLAEIHSRHPNDPEITLALSDTHTLLGRHARAQNNLAIAKSHFIVALELREALALSHPDTRDLPHLLACSHEHLGELSFEKGRLGDAETAFHKALVIREHLAGLQPDNAIWLESKALLHHSLGQLYEQRGDTHQALEAYSDSYSLLDGLVARDPTNIHWREAYAQRLLAGGELYLYREQAERARATLIRARDGFLHLLKIDPGNHSWRRELAISLTLIGTVDLREDPAKAEDLFGVAIAHLETLTRAQPENTEWQHDLAVAFGLLSRAQLRQGHLEAAEDSHQRGFERLSALTRQTPEQLDWQRDLAIAYDARTHLALQRGQFESARGTLASAVGIIDSLLERDPENALWIEDRKTLQGRYAFVEALPQRVEEEIMGEEQTKTAFEGLGLEPSSYANAPALDNRLQRSDSRVRSRVLEQKHSEKVMGKARRTFFKLLENLDQDPFQAGQR